RSITWSRRRCFSLISPTSTASTRCGSATSRCRRRAPPSAAPGCWSPIHWWRSISSVTCRARDSRARSSLRLSRARSPITTRRSSLATLVEIDLIGYRSGHGLKHEVVKSAAPRPLAHYSEGFTLGSQVFAAGQIASDYRTGVPPQARKQPGFPFYGSDIELQTAYVLDNLKKTFEAAGSSLDHVVKAQVFLTDLDNFHGFDTVWKRYFKVP